MNLRIQLKRLLARFQGRKAITHIDGVCRSAELTVIVGWTIPTASRASFPYSVDGAGWDGFKRGAVYFERPDVTAALGVSPAMCKGFVLIQLNNEDANTVVSLPELDVNDSTLEQFPNESEDSILARIPLDNALVVNFIEKAAPSLPIEIAKVSAMGHDPDIDRIRAILSGINPSVMLDDRKCSELSTQVRAVWSKRQARSNAERHVVLGERVEQPKLSIIVPLYGRHDFMRHQLAAFSSDEDFSNVQLIYVVDDPRLAHVISVSCEGFLEVFKTSFEVVYSEHNLGFAGANNLGVKYARADKLLLLNSDILPRKSGWLTDYLGQFEALDSPGILGATLVYEDETVQHAGMQFKRDASQYGLITNFHPHKGMPLALLNLADVAEVPLVTGACMLMNRSVFDQVEGFDVNYVIGDYEDSDLCLKVKQAGYRVYLSSDVSFYHLERLSQSLVSNASWKTILTMINGYYQRQKWGAVLEESVQ